jgi:hypothetical protein
MSDDFCKCCKYPHWGDTNVKIILTNGNKISIHCPDRIGCEYETPRGDRSGSREWNRPVEEILIEFKNQRLGENARLIVGTWGTGYKEDDYKVSIPVDKIFQVEAISDQISIERAVLRKFEE